MPFPPNSANKMVPTQTLTISNVFNHTETEWTTWVNVYRGTALFNNNDNNLCHNLTMKCRRPVFMYSHTHAHHLYTTYTRHQYWIPQQLTREMHRSIVSQCHTLALHGGKISGTWSLVHKIDTKNKNIVIYIYMHVCMYIFIDEIFIDITISYYIHI